MSPDVLEDCFSLIRKAFPPKVISCEEEINLTMASLMKFLDRDFCSGIADILICIMGSGFRGDWPENFVMGAFNLAKSQVKQETFDQLMGRR